MTAALDQLDKITKNDASDKSSQASAAMDRIRTRALTLNLGHFDWEALKVDRDTDHP